jgi:hypothetical protein
MRRKPFPIHLESGLVPSHNGLRLDKNQRLLPSRPEPPQHNPEEPIRSSKSRLRTSLPQDRKLLPERQVFQQQVAARAKNREAKTGNSLNMRSMRPVSHGHTPDRMNHLSS